MSRVLSELSATRQDFKERAVPRQSVLEHHEDALYEFLERPKSVTFLSWRDLSKYQRFIRMAKSLQKRGCQVRFFFVTADEESESRLRQFDIPGAHFR